MTQPTPGSAEAVNRSVGRLIASARKAAGLTQAEFARLLGRSRVGVANMECGRQGLTIPQIYELAGCLNIEPQQLLPFASQSAPAQRQFPVGTALKLALRLEETAAELRFAVTSTDGKPAGARVDGEQQP